MCSTSQASGIIQSIQSEILRAIPFANVRRWKRPVTTPPSLCAVLYPPWQT